MPLLMLKRSFECFKKLQQNFSSKCNVKVKKHQRKVMTSTSISRFLLSELLKIWNLTYSTLTQNRTLFDQSYRLRLRYAQKYAFIKKNLSKYISLAKSNNNWVKIVDFLIKAYFWVSPETPGTHCICVIFVECFWN